MFSGEIMVSLWFSYILLGSITIFPMVSLGSLTQRPKKPTPRSPSTWPSVWATPPWRSSWRRWWKKWGGCHEKSGKTRWKHLETSWFHLEIRWFWRIVMLKNGFRRLWILCMNTCWFYNEVHLFRFSSRCFVQLSMSKCWSWDGKCEGTTYWIFSVCLLRKHPELGFIWLDIPSGKLTVCELENDHRNSWFTHWKWWFSIVFCMFTRG